MADFFGMMKQAAQLQTKMKEMQEKMTEVEVVGEAAGGLVNVRLTAKGDMKSLAIDPSLMKEGEGEILEDLIVTAHADAKRKAELAMQEMMQQVTGGLSLPAGMKLF